MGILKMLAAILVMASVTIVVEAVAQTQAPPAGQRPPPGAQLPPGEDQIIEGEVRSIDPSGTEITLTDGTRLITPPGATLKPGVLTEGMKVIASYREHNGNKVLTELRPEGAIGFTAHRAKSPRRDTGWSHETVLRRRCTPPLVRA